MHTEFHGIAHVLHGAHAAEHDLGVVAVVVHGAHALLHEGEGVVALVLQAADERAHVAGTGLHGHVSLLDGVHQVHVHHDALVAQHAAGTQALQAHGDLEDGGLLFQAHLQLALGLLHHLLGGLAQGLHLQDGDLFGEVQDHLVDVGDPAPVHEGGRGGEAGEEAELEGFVDLLDVGAVEVEFHGMRSAEWIGCDGLALRTRCGDPLGREYGCFDQALANWWRCFTSTA